MRSEDERRVVHSLMRQYPIFAESTIRRWVAHEAGRYRHARITTFVPVLVERSVDATLRELSRTEGTSSDQLSLVDGGRLAVR